MNSQDFRNELGNQIHVEVDELEVSGVPGVRLFIAGPTSDMELLITRKEAEVLSEHLAALLNKLAE